MTSPSPFHPFAVEQFLSENEQKPRFNFSESGVHPMTFGELLDIAGIDMQALAATPIDYPEVNGAIGLRETIAALYPGASADNVLATVGASEANALISSTLLAAGDTVVAFKPTYQQLPGQALNRGVTVRTVDLVESRSWALDTDALAGAMDDRVRLIHVVNPNNPTGRILTNAEMDSIVNAADAVGAWIVADEVYAGTEREHDTATPGFWGRYDKVIAINSMSKAYGLPGLRLGWLVAPETLIPDLWRRHEYTTISATMLANRLAEAALGPQVRPKIVNRARRLIRTGFETLAAGLAEHPGVFNVVPPQASAMSFVGFDLAIDADRLAARLLEEKSMLVIPGSCFGMQRHFRFSFALPEEYLREGLARLNALVTEIRAGGSPAPPGAS
jgi:aspartate/methionine/tyrosine aminotransferase